MTNMIERLEAALGDAHDPVKVALVAGDLRELIAAHKEATAKRDTLRAELGAGLGDALQRTSDLAREVFELRQERDAEKAKHKALREAAGAMLAALAKNGRPCGACYAIATWAEPLPCGGSAYRCDQHHKHDDPDEDGLSPSETEVAAPLRALRAALKEEP